jgi:hypothetical protein
MSGGHPTLKHLPDWDEACFQQLVPVRYQAGLRRYFEEFIRPGGALSAILANDLAATLASVDRDVTMDELRNLATFLYSYAPSRALGSRKAVSDWVESDGEDEPDTEDRG